MATKTKATGSRWVNSKKSYTAAGSVLAASGERAKRSDCRNKVHGSFYLNENGRRRQDGKCRREAYAAPDVWSEGRVVVSRDWSHLRDRLKT